MPSVDPRVTLRWQEMFHFFLDAILIPIHRCLCTTDVSDGLNHSF